MSLVSVFQATIPNWSYYQIRSKVKCLFVHGELSSELKKIGTIRNQIENKAKSKNEMYRSHSSPKPNLFPQPKS